MLRITKSAGRRTAGVGLAVAAALVLAGCSSAAPGGTSSGSAQKPVTLGFSPYNQSAAALVGLAKGAQGYAKSKGANLLVADPNNSSTKQVQQIRSWMQLGQVQGVWTIALNPSEMQPLFDLAKSKNIALLTTGSPTEYGVTAIPTNVSFTQIDYTQFGTALGDQLGRCANERLGGKGLFLYLANDPGQDGKAAQDAAVAAALKKVSPNSKIVSTATFGGVQLTAQQKTLSALQANPGLNGAVGGTDESTLGPMTAFTQAGKNLTKSCIVGGGGNDAALAAVKARTIYADVAIQFAGEMTQDVDELLAMTKDLGKPGKQLHTPTKIVTK